MARPTTWVEATKKAKEEKKIVSSQNCKPSFIPRPKPINPTTPSAPLKIQKLTKAEMAERQLKGLCYNCDDKYFPGHKFKEQNLFMAISEDTAEEDVETPLVSESPKSTDIMPPSDPPQSRTSHFPQCSHWLLLFANRQANWVHQASESHYSD